MKKLYFLLLVVLTFGQVSAQVEPLNVTIHNDLHNQENSQSTNNYTVKTTLCSNDTVQYPIAKATGLTSLNINNATSAQAAGQYYNAPQPLTISGVEFYAYKIDATGGITSNVTVAIYMAGTDSLPTGSAIATTTIAVDTAFGGGTLSVLKKVATFAPITVSAPYIVVLGNYSANGVGIIFSDYTVADGADEWLCDIDLFGTWTRSYDVNVGGVPMNADLLAYPIVSYDLTADFDVANPCLSSGQTATFTNTSSPVMFDRMYNQAVFLGVSALSFTYDFGDGSNTVNAVDTFNLYSGPSSFYTVTLTDTIYGWTTTCFDEHTEVVGDSLDPSWSFIQNTSVFSFTDESYAETGVTSWLWDFGDGNTSTMQNPSHTYASEGSYTVCLTIASNCGADSSCQTVDYSSCVNPVATFTTTNSEPSFDFTNTSTTSGTTTYSWDMGDGTTFTTEDASHTYTSNNTYTVTLTVTDSCGTSTTTGTVSVTSAGLNLLSENRMSVYPNPANNQFRIEADSPIQLVTIYDMYGKVVYDTNASASNDFLVSTVNWAHGYYTVKAVLSDGLSIYKKMEILH